MLEVRFEVVHVYFAQHCFFLPLPHVLVGIQNAAATSEKTKDPSLQITGSQTLDEGLLPKRVDSYAVAGSLPWASEGDGRLN